jgi:DNA-binding response OmpR family regulator
MWTFLHCALLQEAAYHVLLAMQGFEALKVIHYITPQLFILNYHLLRMNGMSIPRELDELLAIVKTLVALPVKESAS